MRHGCVNVRGGLQSAPVTRMAHIWLAVLLATACTEPPPEETPTLSIQDVGGISGAGSTGEDIVTLDLGKACFGDGCGEPFYCGDGDCSGDETPAGCCADCGCGMGFQCVENTCQVAPACGDGDCQPGQGENCQNCADCPCAEGETCSTGGVCCAPDCTTKTCGPDGCGGTCGSCGGGAVCDNGICVATTVCGDGVCDAELNEHCGTCDADCKCQTLKGEVCLPDGAGCCKPTCSGKHCGSDGCVGTCGTCDSGMSCTDNLCVKDG